jgi:hypothetical protein
MTRLTAHRLLPLLPLIGPQPMIRVRGFGTPDWIFLAWPIPGDDAHLFEVDFNWVSGDPEASFRAIESGDAFSEARILPAVGKHDPDLEVPDHLLPAVKARLMPHLPVIMPELRRVVREWQAEMDEIWNGGDEDAP